ncbi:lipopolysaccharide transport system ATP-binding protein [Acetoanaerobium pronyense]|uniref:Lipopolysaccharide transport system ATP-binding protein n=1 Tax=Acetoanaerobium pronyense TaxID=1482736 RepID=A0ABS4KKI0_9FIRM|nr:ABC transporter ATP-binding protein [Acetoanaerobium pronyense]MBP2027139.1 lipopolysaccharide transport system ATP-binding protein [Acetoanaerobium pronyense]
MSASIELKNVNLKFKLYSTKQMSLKEFLINKLNKKNYNKYKEFYALRDINLLFNEGERIGIIGNNGAGKSTLLKLISQIYYPESGFVKVEGSIAPLIELGAGFNQELTGRENIYLNGAILGYSEKQLKDMEEEIIDFSDLNEFIDTPVKYYSTGMYGRLAFTVATQIRPNILIVDEIFAGGDINFIDKARKRMDDIITESNIVIMVSHSLDLITKICDRVVVLEKGSVIYDGLPSEAIEFYKSRTNI